MRSIYIILGLGSTLFCFFIIIYTVSEHFIISLLTTLVIGVIILIMIFKYSLTEQSDIFSLNSKEKVDKPFKLKKD